VLFATAWSCARGVRFCQRRNMFESNPLLGGARAAPQPTAVDETTAPIAHGDYGTTQA